MRKPFCGVLCCLYVASFSALAAEERILDVQADPVHYKVEFENNCVYVTRANFGPHEKMPGFFDAKDAVLVSLTDSGELKLNYPDGHSVVTPPWRAGAVFWAPAAGRIQQENPFDTRLEFIAIELRQCK